MLPNVEASLAWPEALEFFIRLGISLACGAVVGLERTHHRKPAGLRTNVLICMGACLFTMASILSANGVAKQPAEVGRISAQIVTGIGFLGAGAILRSGLSVLGLTTAASIWFVAAIGMLVGLGYYLLGFISSLAALFVLTALNRLEFWFQTHFPPHESDAPSPPAANPPAKDGA